MFDKPLSCGIDTQYTPLYPFRVSGKQTSSLLYMHIRRPCLPRVFGKFTASGMDTQNAPLSLVRVSGPPNKQRPLHAKQLAPLSSRVWHITFQIPIHAKYNTTFNPRVLDCILNVVFTRDFVFSSSSACLGHQSQRELYTRKTLRLFFRV